MERRFSTTQVKKALGVSTGFMKGLTRTSGGKKALFEPTFPATSSGKKDFYSFENILVLKIVLALRTLKVSRDWIPLILEAAKEWKDRAPWSSPFSQSASLGPNLEWLIKVRLVSIPLNLSAKSFDGTHLKGLIEISAGQQYLQPRAGLPQEYLIYSRIYLSMKSGLDELPAELVELYKQVGQLKPVVEWVVCVSELREELCQNIEKK